MRSQAVAQGISNTIDAIGGVLRVLTAKFAKYMAYRKVHQTLSEMTDRELDDIGLSRGDIETVARGNDPRPRREAYLATVVAQHADLEKTFDAKGVAVAEKAAVEPGVADQGVNDNRTVAAA
ncbi:DUF1127 domain-containing protein [Pelagibius litoralis]|uniref:DUF1127 domain-containing protein n=2 Tax=Pelagibius litoralis TaxID=374515 RepID=A0A967C1R7_9PROT|nr:DUF1127 domain-containing protein [Pelagibius litoralis]